MIHPNPSDRAASLRAELETYLAEHRPGHDDFQIDHFIIRRGGGRTAYGQYVQALREVNKRYRGLKGLYSERDLLQVDIDEDVENARLDGREGFQVRRDDLKLRSSDWRMEDLVKSIQDTEREFRRFFSIARGLKAVLGEITPDRKALLEREQWIDHMEELAAVDFVARGCLQESTVSAIASLPADARQELLDKTKNHQKDLILALEDNPETCGILPGPYIDVRAMVTGK